MTSFPFVLPSNIVCHNVLAHADLHCGIDLKAAVKIFRNAEYDPVKFACVRVRYWQHGCTVSIFSNGKVQTAGGKSTEEARLALKKAAYRLKTKGVNDKVRFTGFRVENILATMDLGVSMNLLGLSRDREIVSTYEPTRFSAVVIRDPAGSGVTIDVFSTGKVNLKGSESTDKLCTAVNKVMHILQRHACEALE